MSFNLEYEWADVAQSPDEAVHRTMAKLLSWPVSFESRLL